MTFLTTQRRNARNASYLRSTDIHGRSELVLCGN